MATSDEYNNVSPLIQDSCTMRRAGQLPWFVLWSLQVLPWRGSAGEGECRPSYFRPQMASGCRHIYIDMGTNIGHQIRKLYEPKLYPGNPTEEIYAQLFGVDRDHVCTFGFEANPRHTNRLKVLEQAYSRIGRRVRIFTSTAVSTHNQDVTFYQDPGAEEHNEWGASLAIDFLADRQSLKTVTVSAIDIACWFKAEIAARRIPLGTLPASILIKSDIENHDTSVLTHMLTEGVLCHVDLVYGEHMSEEWLAAMTMIMAIANCSTKFVSLDDESGDDALPLPSQSFG